MTSGVVRCPAGEREPPAAAPLAREASFELTFSNRDLTWFADPASPTAMLYLRPGAQPIATDVSVRTLKANPDSPQRRYMHEARIVATGDTRTVYAFTPQREKVIGTIDDRDRFTPNEFYRRRRDLLPSWPNDASVLAYDAEANSLFFPVVLPGPAIRETLDFLPLSLFDRDGNRLSGKFLIEYTPHGDGNATPTVALKLGVPQHSVTLAQAAVPLAARRDDVQLGSFDNPTGSYLPESAYRPGADENVRNSASVTMSVAAAWTSAIDRDSSSLVLIDPPRFNSGSEGPQTKITIDGNFEDWRNVAGIDDPRGDLVPYLEYVPDVDLLEFKVAHDDHHLYLYARVAGQVGRSHPDGGRSYFYAYMDVDQDPETGFLPTRDDDCYFGVDIGDDCEVQFEFVDNRLRKTFYGFCGLGGDAQVLAQTVTLGKSQYGRYDASGNERAHYKSEYIYRRGATEITEDLKLGTSDTIELAISPNGREVEIVSALAGFLKDQQGRPIVAPGQTIDLAVGMECDSKAYVGKSRWAADSTLPIRGYHLSPSPAK